MGIPGLAAKLRPFAKSVLWQNPPNDGKNENDQGLVIDGPGFAYWIYYQAIASRGRTSHAFADIPSYVEVSRLAFTWLSRFESFGLCV